MTRSYLPSIAGYIPRPRVDALIRKGLGNTLVHIVAGPGYGKTLSLAYFMREATVRLVWVRVSSTEAEASGFWDAVVKAAYKELPEYAAKLEELGFPDTAGTFEQFYKATEGLLAGKKRLVFVVDNYERILDAEITDFLNRLAGKEPPNFTLFILCNVMRPFADVLPATGQFRITDRDLAFTVEEAGQMYAQYGAAGPPAVIERAVKETGGWPLGLRLVCESNPENPEDYSNRSTLQLTADLYEQHYFRNFSKAVRQQLVLFSLLPQFSSDMMGTETDISKEALGYLLMKHPFVSYDYASGLFMYQAMYHDFLRQRQPHLSQKARTETLEAAGWWFLQHGMVDEAMDCFWDAADYDAYLEAVGRLPKMRKPTAATNRVLRRLEQIPQSYAATHPVVDQNIAYMHLNAGNIHKAREIFLGVAAQLEAAPDTEEKRLLLGDVYAMLADIATYLNEDTGLVWMKKAHALVPEGTRVHTPELLALGNNSAFFLPNGEAGQLEHMVAYFFEYTEYADQVKNGCGHGYEFLFAGEAAFYREEMAHAAEMFNSAILKAQQTAQHDILLNALWGLGRIALYYGNHKDMLAVLQEMESYVDNDNLVDMYELRDCAMAYFHLWLEDEEKVPARFGNLMTGPEASPLSIARKHLISACYLRWKGEEAKSIGVLRYLEPLLENKGQWSARFYLYFMKAQHAMAERAPARFLAEFQKMYEMVYGNNLKLCLSSCGRQMTAMLDYLKRQDTSGFDMAWLSEVYEDAASTAKRLQVMQMAYKSGGRSYRSSVALTKREDETLHYLAQGLTQKEMARLMGISDNAVKKHISKIYYKLGAVNRADAIHIATVNGLVDVINN